GRRHIVHAIGTDGGSIPRNTTVEQGLALVRFRALTLEEFVLKTSYAPAQIYGLRHKGHLGVGADADVTVLNLETGKAVMSFALGRPVMVDGVVVGDGGVMLTGERGVAAAREAHIQHHVVSFGN